MLWKDLRHGFRLLARKPLFTAIAVLTLALGIGAGTTIFSVVDSVLVEPLPYEESEQLAMIWTRFQAQGSARSPASGAELADFRHESTLFEGIAGIWPRFGSLGGVDDPEQIHIGWVTSNFFEILGAKPLAGRTFLPNEDVLNGPKVILLSHSVWQRRYGGDRGIVGETVEYNNEPYTVVGVMPRGFAVMMPPDAGLPDFGAWLPWQGTPYAEMRRGFRVFRLLGRLEPGASFAAARLEMESVAARLAARHVEYADSGLEVETVPLHADLVAPVRPALLALVGSVAFVMLIACANVANLLLIRVAERGREMAMRTALGAGTLQTVRQMLVESALLFLFGGAAGALVALGALELLEYLHPANLPRLEEIALDRRALAFNFLAALATGLAFGALPAWQATRSRLFEALKEGGRSAAGSVRQRVQSLLVVAEVALSITLLIGAVLMLRSFLALGKAERGFRSEDVLTARMSLPSSGYPYSEPEKISSFYQQLVDRIAESSGVEAVGTTDFPPLGGAASVGDPYAYQTPRGETEWGTLSADYRVVTPDYFRALGTRRVAGRFFTRHDDLEHPLVVIVDEKLAGSAWPDQNPIGQQLKAQVFLRHTEARWAEVVGVVEHIQNDHLGVEGREQIYLSHLQSPRRSMTLAVRSSIATASLRDLIRREVRAIDPSRPIFDVRPLSAYEEDAMAQTRFTMFLLAAFAALAAVLAAVGLYGVIAYLVRRSTRDIGIRMALGARRWQVLLQVLGKGIRLAVFGTVVGLAAAVALGRVLESLVFGVEVRDVTIFVQVALLSLAVAVWASFFPARQATRIDPMTALRSE